MSENTMTYRWPGTTDCEEAWATLCSFTGNLAFDVGANIGQAATALAANFKKVVAFEPCEESCAILNAEAPANVLPMQIAVSATAGEIVLTESARSILSGQLTTGEGLQWGETVGQRTLPSTTLDEAAHALGTPDLVVIDTEGHEVEVLKGGTELFAVAHPRLYVEVHRQRFEREIRDLLPDYEWRVIRWPGHPYREGSVKWEHFWMVGTWS